MAAGLFKRLSDYSQHPTARKIYLGSCVFVCLCVLLVTSITSDEAWWKTIRLFLESSNGATWSTECQSAASCEPRWLFALAVAFRTTLNWAVAIAFLVGVLLALTAPWREIMNAITLESRVRLHERSLLQAVLTMIESRHPAVAADTKLQQDIKAKADQVFAQLPEELGKPTKQAVGR